jgi:5'-nucleotidase/UDP-sugar diphosphatase
MARVARESVEKAGVNVEQLLELLVKKGAAMRRSLLALILAALCAASLAAEPKRFTILHTNDLHSHLQGVSPELDYSPLTAGDDRTIGGWSRLAAVIGAVRAERDNPVLVLDAGDFLMGSLFHMVAREESLELVLMKAMGYDAVSLGNHEFDLMPDGLARILSAARAKGALPPIVFSSASFDPADPKDDSLEKAFAAGLVRPYRLIEKGGVRFGLFALMGRDAAEVSPFASPVKFRDPVEVARQMVARLRSQEKADVVICLSHSGLSADPAKSEDLLLAKAVPGIDIIVSGHTHTRLEAPIVEGGTIIVQAWEYGKQVGVLDFAFDAGKVSLLSWRPVALDDSAAGDPAIQARIESFKRILDERVLAGQKLSYGQVLAETGFDLKAAEAETGLGNLVADSIRWYVDRLDSDPADPATRVAMAVESGGVIRDELLRGTTGRITTADLFRVLPLGVGLDGSMAYPLISVYLSGSEIRKTLEIVASVYPLKGSDYFLQVSGVRFRYNPRRVLFDRVTSVEMGGTEEGWRPLDTSARNPTLYRVVANYYNSAFLKLIGGFTFHILDIVPKDAHGVPIEDLATARVDSDRLQPGIQETKEWVGLMEYVRSFPDADGDGIPDIPARYAAPEGRILRVPSYSPVALFAHAGWVTWAVVGVVALVLAILAGLVVLIVWLARRGRRRASVRRLA